MMEQSSRPDEISVAAPEPAEPPSSEKSGDKPACRAGGIALRALCLLLETLLLLAAAVYGLMFVLTKGPSDTAGCLRARRHPLPEAVLSIGGSGVAALTTV